MQKRLEIRNLIVNCLGYVPSAVFVYWGVFPFQLQPLVVLRIHRFPPPHCLHSSRMRLALALQLLITDWSDGSAYR